MVNDIQIVHVIAECLRKYSPEHIIYDPVMVSTSGRKLMTDEAIEEIKNELLPLVTLITPNIDEAMVLTGNSIQNTQDMLAAAKQLSIDYQTHILIKGGHLEGDKMCDLLYSPDHTYYIYEEKKDRNQKLTWDRMYSLFCYCKLPGKRIFDERIHPSCQRIYHPRHHCRQKLKYRAWQRTSVAFS